MATDTRRAARQSQRIYAVRLLSGPETAVDLAEGLTDLLEAVEFALEWLDRVDPGRERATRLAILETREGVTEEVWTYPSELRDDGPGLVEVFGFDPVTWRSRVREFSAAGQTLGLGERTRLAGGRAAPARAADLRSRPPEAPAPAVFAEEARSAPEPIDLEPASPAEAAVPRGARVASGVGRLAERGSRLATEHASRLATGRASRLAATVHEGRFATVRGWIELATRGAWDDPFSRACVIVSAAAVWLALGFADPLFLIPLLVSLPALYRRQRSRAEKGVDADDDWF